jgi:hypothetical protein
VAFTGTRRSVADMTAEALREIGALAMLFIPLDYLFAEKPVWSAIQIIWVTGVVGGGIFGLGVAVELLRERSE